MIAERLGLEIKPQQMEWSALIQATKQGKVDIMLGAMGWTEERTQGHAPDRSDLLLRHVPAAEEGEQLHDLRRHEGPLGRHGDRLHAGAGAEDGRRASARSSSTTPPTASCATSSPAGSTWRCSIRRWSSTRSLQHPEWELHQVALKPEPDQYPIMSTKYYVDHGHLTRKSKELHDALNGEIAKAWAELRQRRRSWPSTAWATRPGSTPPAGLPRSASTGRRTGRRRPRRRAASPKLTRLGEQAAGRPQPPLGRIAAPR